MARDPVVERGREMCSLAIVAGETRVRLRNVGGRAVQRRKPVLRRHGQDLEGGLRAVAATNGQIEDLGLAAVCRHLQVALGAVDGFRSAEIRRWIDLSTRFGFWSKGRIC